MTLRYFFLSILILMLNIGCNSSSSKTTNFTVTIEAEGIYDGVRAYIKRNENGKTTTATDTAIAQNGKFQFKGEVLAPEMRFITIDGINGQVFFVLEPENINLTIYKDSIQKSKVSGGFNNEVFSKYRSGFVVITTKLDKLREEYAAAAQNPKAIQDLQKRNVELREELKNYGFNFLKENYNSDFSLMLLDGLTSQPKFDTKSAKEVLALMNDELLNKSTNILTVQNIQSKINQTTTNKKLGVGDIAPDFTAPNPDGTAVTMSKIKGKVTIIDFWASWCKPCRVENPTYVRLYEKYHNKGLEIISFSLDRENQKQRWIDAIAKDKLTWYNVSNLKFWNDPVAKLYNVSSIPAAFIIDEEGVIIAERLRGSALERKIAELLD
ncbi:MAG: redoxin domain-containing protein [Flavobacteriaceae bacterium]